MHEIQSLLMAIGDGNIVTVNDLYEIISIDPNSGSMCMLTETKAIACYRDSSDDNNGYAVILDISGTEVTGGTPVQYSTTGAWVARLTRLSDTKAIVVFNGLVSSGEAGGRACILDVTGSTITPGTVKVFQASDISVPVVATLSSSKVIVAYSLNYTVGKSCILGITGSTITVDSSHTTFNNNRSNHLSITVLSSTQAITCYKDYTGTSGDNYGTACLLGISGNTITPETPVVFQETETEWTDVVTLTSTRAVVFYKDDESPYQVFGCVLDISGDTITANDPNQISEYGYSSSQPISATTLTSSKVTMCYWDSNDSEFKVLVVVISGTDLVKGTEVQLSPDNSTTYWNYLAALSNNKVIVWKRAQDSPNNTGSSLILTIG